MSYCIIIRGPLGVGKTAVAKKLAKALRGKYVSIDLLLAKKGLDKVDKKSNRILLANFIKAADSVLPELKSSLKKGPIILDGNFYHREQIAHLMKSLDCEFYIFTLKASLEVCMLRDSGRKKPYGKSATKAVYALVSKLNYGKSINTKTKTSAEVIKEILKYLPKNGK